MIRNKRSDGWNWFQGRVIFISLRDLDGGRVTATGGSRSRPSWRYLQSNCNLKQYLRINWFVLLYYLNKRHRSSLTRLEMKSCQGKRRQQILPVLKIFIIKLQLYHIFKDWLNCFAVLLEQTPKVELDKVGDEVSNLGKEIKLWLKIWVTHLYLQPIL